MKRYLVPLLLVLAVVAWADFPGSPIGGPSLTTGSVTSAYILDGAIVNADVNASAGIVGTKLADNTVTNAKLLDNTIAGGKLASDIVIATTGAITGKISLLDNVTSPTAAQCYGTNDLVNTTGTTVLLPTAVAGMSICVTDVGATHDNVIVDVAAGDNVILLGTVQLGGVGITNASGTSVGDYVCFIATAASKWRVFGYQGSWVSQ